METLAAMGFDRRTIEYFLNRNGGNVEETLEQLLAGATVNEITNIEQSNQVRQVNYSSPTITCLKITFLVD